MLRVQTVPAAWLRERWIHRLVHVTAMTDTASTPLLKPHANKSSATSSVRHAKTQTHFAHHALQTLSVPWSLAPGNANATQNTSKPTMQHVQRVTILVSNARVVPLLIARAAMQSDSESQMELEGVSAWISTTTRELFNCALHVITSAQHARGRVPVAQHVEQIVAPPLDVPVRLVFMMTGFHKPVLPAITRVRPVPIPQPVPPVILPSLLENLS